MRDLARQALEWAAARGETVGCAESLTGGLLADALVRVPGASRAFRGSVVAYHENVKAALLRVPREVLERYSAVSRQTALCMARGARAALGADRAVSVTGYAGPEGADVGLVYIGYADARGEAAVQCRFAGDRAAIRHAAVRAALELLCQQMQP